MLVDLAKQVTLQEKFAFVDFCWVAYFVVLGHLALCWYLWMEPPRKVRVPPAIEAPIIALAIVLTALRMLLQVMVWSS